MPIGVTKVRVTANLQWTDINTTGTRNVYIKKNNVAAYDGAANKTLLPFGASASHITVTTPVLEVVAGNYFTLAFLQDSTGSINVITGANGTWFAMEIIA